MRAHLKTLARVAALISCVAGTVSAQQKDPTENATVALVSRLPNASFGAVVQRSPSGTVILLDRKSSIADLNAALHVARAIAAKRPMRPDGFESFGISRTPSQAVRDPAKRKHLQRALATLHLASRRDVEKVGQVRAMDVSVEQ